jgi:hypothetical protein
MMNEPKTDPTLEEVTEKLNETLAWLKDFYDWGLKEGESDEDGNDRIAFGGGFPPPPPPPNLL